ncbi:hypothetical protein ERY430_40449 [Erythrobacter sp. EC-HK427]|nr:hypothetical protein ERY430_40449 [Erythrobacter sp. EC-HK427]
MSSTLSKVIAVLDVGWRFVGVTDDASRFPTSSSPRHGLSMLCRPHKSDELQREGCDPGGAGFSALNPVTGVTGSPFTLIGNPPPKAVSALACHSPARAYIGRSERMLRAWMRIANPRTSPTPG